MSEMPKSMPTIRYPKSLIISVIIAILLLAINMRAPIIGFGVVAKLIQVDLGLSTQTIGLVGTIPVMAFAMSSFIAPMLSRRFGLENTLVLAAMLLAMGIFVRSWQPTLGYLVVGTVVLSVAISLGNVLAPAVIKKYTPTKISLVMGTYSLFLSLFAGIAAGLIPTLVSWHTWEFALSSWGWVSVAALVAWLWVVHLKIRQQLSSSNHQYSSASHNESDEGAQALYNDTDGHGEKLDTQMMNQSLAYTPPAIHKSVWKMPMAWFISFYLGLQSLLYYTFASFLPSLLMDKGLTQVHASQMGMIFQLMAFPSIILLSKWVAAGWNIRILAMAAAVGNLIGVLGFGFLSVEWSWLWAVCAGFGCGVIFTLCMMLFTIKGQDSQQTADLSGMAQTVGYSIAIFGPILTGWLKDFTQGWLVPMLFLLILMVLECIFAWVATQDKPIDG